MRAIIAQYGVFSDERVRLLDALKRSAAANSPELELEIMHPEPHKETDPDRFAPKLRAWSAAVHYFKEDLLLLDADCLLLGDVTVLPVDEFDVAHAPRPGNFRYNTGVVFVRPSEKTRLMMRVWLNRTEFWGLSKPLRRQARRGYLGTDQAAFAEALELLPELRVHELDYTEWNLCQDFGKLTPATRVLHLKGGVHRMCLAGEFDKLHPNVVRQWRKYGETLAME